MVRRKKKLKKEADRLAEKLAQIRRENEILRVTNTRLEDELARIGPIETPSDLLPEATGNNARLKGRETTEA